MVGWPGSGSPEEPPLRAPPDPGVTLSRLRLTPPLRARLEEIEVVVTGRLSRVRIVVPVGPGPEMPDT
jgi:hypothetical protein